MSQATSGAKRRSDGVSGALVYLVVDDVDALHEDLLRRHVAVDMPPTDQTWGTREMYVRDDGGRRVRGKGASR